MLFARWSWKLDRNVILEERAFQSYKRESGQPTDTPSQQWLRRLNPMQEYWRPLRTRQPEAAIFPAVKAGRIMREAMEIRNCKHTEMITEPPLFTIPHCRQCGWYLGRDLTIATTPSGYPYSDTTSIGTWE